MLKARSILSARTGLFLLALLLFTHSSPAPDLPTAKANAPKVAEASNEGELAIKKFKVPAGMKIDLIAAEPHLANPVSFCFDEQGRIYVVETFRLHKGVTDIRGHMNWLDEELAAKSTADLVNLFKKYDVKGLTEESERVKLIYPGTDGKAERSVVFAENFNSNVDGIAAGVLARKGNVYLANIPNLWLLRDNDGDGKADGKGDVRKPLHYGFGVRVGFLGHDLHGLRIGPDGKLYFSIGDRGASIKTPEGKTVDNPEMGAVYRCNQDGSDLELFATGLRNPQELTFDEHGNLFTGDNNSDGGDQARWVYLVEGGDSGWRVGWQFIEKPNSRGPWNSEKMWHPQNDAQPAYLVPPIANIASGPSGITHYPGTGLPEKYQGHFFLSDFRGGSGASGIHTFTLKPKGASFELVGAEQFVWNVLATDVDFGVDGGIYISDWVEGWGLPGKGRIYRVHDPVLDQDPLVRETKKLIAEDLTQRPVPELAKLLAHRDQRVRQEAQFALVEKGSEGQKTLAQAAAKNDAPLAQLHAIWGLGQIAAKAKVQTPKTAQVTQPLVRLLTDKDAEVRAQAAKVLGDARNPQAVTGLIKLLQDESLRVRSFAAISLGKLGDKKATAPLLEMLRSNADQDPVVRHAGVMGLVGINDQGAILAAGKDAAAAVRMGSLLALRRLQSPEIAMFLVDTEPKLVLEAARAINDVPIYQAMPKLAALITRPNLSEPLARRVLNANYRFGIDDAAKALASFAARPGATEAQRSEALAELGEWAKPSGRDQVVGLWRPLSPRDGTVAANALKPLLTDILLNAPEGVRLVAAQVSNQLGIKEAGPALAQLVADKKISGRVRAEALKALEGLKDVQLEASVKLALTDENEVVRKEGSRLQAKLHPEDSATPLLATLEKGSVSEKQNALAILGTVPGGAADEILAGWLDKWLAKNVPAELQLDLLEAAGKRTAPAIKERLKKIEDARDKNDPLMAYRTVLAGGDAAEGKKVFFERAEVSCFRCHQVNGEGGEVGPVLTGIGTRQKREYLLESLVLPNKVIAAGFETLLVTMKNGTIYAGLVKSESAEELVLNSPEDGILKIKTSDIKARAKGASAMPEGMVDILARRDLRNLIEFLASLK
jgi:quinoprotein glucose dehydrogenase